MPRPGSREQRNCLSVPGLLLKRSIIPAFDGHFGVLRWLHARDPELGTWHGCLFVVRSNRATLTHHPPEAARPHQIHPSQSDSGEGRGQG
jgi:hypothetical protein